jgi:hypothetical protein
MCELETILDWQQRGITARILGLSPSQNPLLKYQPQRSDPALQDWRQKVEAWSFGWEIENAMRNETGTAVVSK